VFAAIPEGEIATTNRVMSTDGPLCIGPDVGKATFEDLDYWGQTVLVPLSDEYYFNDLVRTSLADISQNAGIRNWVHDTATFYNLGITQPSSIPLTPEEIHRQNIPIDFFAPRFFRDTGLVLADTVRIISNIIPSPPEGNLIIYYDDEFSNPGNARFPPGSGPLTWGYAFNVNGFGDNYYISEVGELIGLREGTGGSNGHLYVVDNIDVITGLSDLGKRVLVHAWTHRTYDFAVDLSSQ
jgi:hypothetical protein